MPAIGVSWHLGGHQNVLAKVIDGTALSRQVRVRCRERIEKLRRVRSITPDLAAMTRQADILMVAIGHPAVVRHRVIIR